MQDNAKVSFSAILAVTALLILIVFSQSKATASGLVCDVNNDGVVNSVDILLIRAALNTPALPGDPRDANNDGVINVADMRYCQLRCTSAGCA